MENLALYREWRPQSFRDVVGQEHVCRTLRNAVLLGRVAHAYLFCGPRGTGKTSTARILAKAANCLDSQGGEPCNRCTSCRSITAGTAFDVIEMDAASHRGIEEIRDLKQKVGLAPTSQRYKFYIIDEVHMLTGEAFNALLKTLEEPPYHAKFILATTEVHKVPPTILSRCQRFDFRRLSRGVIEEHLARIAREKGWEIEAEALRLLSRYAGGALRDALGLLDQAASFAEGCITKADIEAITGGLSEELLQSVLDAVFRGNIPDLLSLLDRFWAEGCDARQILFQLAEYVRDRLLSPGLGSTEVSAYAAVLSGLAAAEGDMKAASRPDLILELALFRLAGVMQPAGLFSQNFLGSLNTSLKGEEQEIQQQERPRGERPRNAENASSESLESGGAPELDAGELKKFLFKWFQKQPLIARCLPSCGLSQEEERIVIRAPSSLIKELLEKDDNFRHLQQGIKRFKNYHWKVEILSGGEEGGSLAGNRLRDYFGAESREKRESYSEKESITGKGSNKEKSGLEKEMDLNTGVENSIDGLRSDLNSDPVGVALSLFKGEIIKTEGDDE